MKEFNSTVRWREVKSSNFPRAFTALTASKSMKRGGVFSVCDGRDVVKLNRPGKILTIEQHISFGKAVMQPLDILGRRSTRCGRHLKTALSISEIQLSLVSEDTYVE